MEKPESFQSDLLSGLSDSWRGWRKVEKPAAWDAFQTSIAKATNEELRNQIRELNALFGDGRALDELKRITLDDSKEIPERQAALESLIETRSPKLREICEKLLAVKFLNSTAVRGLASFDDPAIGKVLASSYQSFHPFDRPAVMAALTSRPSFSAAMFDAMVAGKIPRSDLTPFQARQVRSFNDPKLTAQLAEVWGEVRDSPAEKQKLIAAWKEKLTPAAVAAGDKSQGRVVFNKSCATCHSLYGYGDRTGLDLTGSGRDNLDYLLGNIVDPSAVVNADFRMKVVQLADGRTLNGMVIANSERTITLKTAQETIVIDRAEIEAMQDSTLSLMPEGMLETLKESEVRDLIAYLMHASQVPLPEKP
jgi:putative heme-binding domain-containing protein